MVAQRRVAVVALLSVLLLGACASARGTSSAGGDRDRLTREQVLGVQGARNLYDAIQQLRPRWLQVRGGDRSFGMATEVVVYQDQTYLGDVDTLRQLGTDMAYELRWIDGPTASATLTGIGSRHVAGAIILYTRAR